MQIFVYVLGSLILSNPENRINQLKKLEISASDFDEFMEKCKIENDRESSSMYDVVCSQCGAKCQVPFKPDGVRPVYCNDCWSEKRNFN